MLNLHGYTLVDLIHPGSRCLLYRGRRDVDGLPVVLKTSRNRYPSTQEIARLKQDYEIGRSLSGPGVLGYHAFERLDSSVALIMDDCGAAPLSGRLQRGPMAVSEMLSASIALAEALRGIHESGAVHKDIHPKHILLTADRGVRIIDFSIASLLGSEHRKAVPTGSIEGTLTHVSPEQTGRINRPIDHRSDLYSLGVCFYEMLTGVLPFLGDDPLELTHCHLARTPKPPAAVSSALPEPLSRLVMKLLSKAPEERYQTSAGLKADLEHLRDALAQGRALDLDIGQLDRRGHFRLVQKLYGREGEADLLRAAFERICAGPSEMLLVSGYSGIGKSSLVFEVQKPIVARRGFFAAGKFDQYKRNEPYASLAQAIQELVRQVLPRYGDVLDAWRGRLLSALRDDGGFLVELVPEVELLLGKQPAPPPLIGGDAQRRFNDVLRRFLQVFADAAHPLVVFLDDLQWADPGTLALLSLFTADPGLRYVLWIGAYRDNEVAAHHPMRLMVDEAQAAGARVSEIVLPSFDRGALSELLTDTLRCRPEEAEPLVELMMAKTHGNPFFVNQLLTSLHDEKLLWFDAGSGIWRWDIEAIGQKGITDNVIELMVQRISRFDPPTQAALTMAACIGSRFDLRTLAAVHGTSLKQTAAALWPALTETLVTPLNDAYKLARTFNLDEVEDAEILKMAEQSAYRFLHDRVQQAAYSMIPAERREGVHLQVGALLLHGTDNAREHVFEIVNHLNAGRRLVRARGERVRLAALNVVAGQRAKASSAFEAVLHFCTIAMECLPEEAWEDDYRVAMDCHLEAAEANFLNGRLPEALAVVQVAEPFARETPDRCKLCELKVLLYKMTDELDLAFETAARMLRHLGIEIVRSPDDHGLHQELAATRRALAGIEILDLPEMCDQEAISACRILQEIWPVAFFLGSSSMHVAAMKMVQLSARHGNSRTSVFGYMIYAFAQVWCFDDIEDGYRMGLSSFALHERLGTREIEAKILDMWGGLIQFYKEPLAAARKMLRRGFVTGMEVGDYQWAGYCTQNCGMMCLFGDVDLAETIAFFDQALPTVRKYDPVIFTYISIGREVTASLTQGKPEPGRLVGAWCDEDEIIELGRKNNDTNTIFYIFLAKLSVAMWFGEHERVLTWGEEAEQNSSGSAGVWIKPIFYHHQSIALLATFERIPAERQPACMARVERNLRLIEVWAGHAPENFTHMRLLIRAELSRVRGHVREAARLYDEAIAESRARGFMQYQALACERASHFHRGLGAEIAATAYLKEARYWYQRWGAEAKVRRLDEADPRIAAPTAPDAALVQGLMTAEQIDVFAVVKASQAISSEILLSALPRALMHTALESAGAERGALVLVGRGGFVVEAAIPDEGLAVPALVDHYRGAPRQILYHVTHSRRVVLLDDASSATEFATDDYIATKRPRSVLCLPILRRGELAGILYLENNLVTGAFTPQKVKVLEVLAAQASVSLENARLYDELEQRVEERTRQLREAQEELSKTAHRAGRAEVAANVLHNVGNFLNSVNTSATLVNQSLHSFGGVQLSRLSELFRANQGPLEEAFGKEKGEMICVYLERVLVTQTQWRDDMLEELARLQLNTERIEAIIARQHEHKESTQFLEPVDLAVKIKEAIDLHAIDLEQHGIQVQTDFAEVQRWNVNQYKVEQILVNLINNAVRALADAGTSGGRLLSLRLTQPEEGWVRIEIADSGVGISEDGMEQLFSQGYTTRGQSHGFGLNYCATAVTEMGGRISASSDGPGKGATFIVELPAARKK